MKGAFLISAAMLAVVAGCGDGSGGGNPDGSTPMIDGGGGGADGGTDADTGCQPGADSDLDGLRNDLEGCADPTPRDADGDGMPDWLDPDSDNDGVLDGLEDRNGDGLIGDCDVACTDPTGCPAGFHCSLPPDGAAGVCVAWSCLDGELDPHTADTDGDGVPDGMEGNYICNPTTETNPNGLKPFRTINSVTAIGYSMPDWQIAVEPEAIDGPVAIAGAVSSESAYVFDLSDPAIEVAGFLVTREVTAGETSAVRGAQIALGRFTPALIPGMTTMQLRASGTRNNSLDGYDTILATTVVLNTSATDVTALRDKVVRSLSQQNAADLTFPPVGWTGSPSGQFVVVFQTLFRPEKNQVIYMGAVTALADFDNVMLTTGFHADDAANGTALSNSGQDTTPECEQFQVDTPPQADIIWVVDGSGSMSDDLANVANNATTLFQKAVAAGLDFRMGVTDMVRASQGRFIRTDAMASTGDRWLLPTELALFQTDIQAPIMGFGEEYGATQAAQAITRHIPRDDANPAHVREDAQLVVIIVSDEKPQEIEDAGILGDGDSPATPLQLSQAITELKPYLDIMQANEVRAHAIVAPEPYPACSGGGGEVAWGYIDIVNWFGGQLGSICQPDLGPTMQAIIDDILGDASPIVLEWVPISATIAVTRDGVVVPRSRSMGWDFRASSNAIIFNNLPFDPMNPAEIIISYRRWSEQVPIE